MKENDKHGIRKANESIFERERSKKNGEKGNLKYIRMTKYRNEKMKDKIEKKGKWSTREWEKVRKWRTINWRERKEDEWNIINNNRKKVSRK